MTTQASGASRPVRRWLRNGLFGLLTLIGLIAVLIGGVFFTAALNTPTIADAPVVAQTTQFDGRYLLAASDADMVGTAYADGQLMQIPGSTDTLSLVELPLINATAPVVEIPASNSVTSYPQVVAVAPDGNTIYLAETAAQVEDSVTQLAASAFPPGRAVTVMDVRNGVEAASVKTVEVGRSPSHIAVSADGAYLAVGLREAGRQLAILPTATLDDPATFRYFPVARTNGEPTDVVSSVFWHPSGQFLAVGVSAEEIQFYRVTQAMASGVSLVSHGERITSGYTFSEGQFTRDGQFYLVSEINWDRHPAPLRGIINPPSEMISIRFDATNAAQHTVISRVPVQHSAEGWAISPQEDLVVTVNMGRTYMPDNLSFWPGAQMNSLSLLSFDHQTGQLRAVGEPYGFAGVLPEDAMFDADGDALGVAIYNERENPMGPGVIEFWNVVRNGEAPRLERTAVRLDVVRGAHTMNIIP